MTNLAPPVAQRRNPSRHASDTFFLETQDALQRLSVDPDEFACRTALLLLKPDAAVTGGMRRAVTWLTEHGYLISGAHPVKLTRLHLRALWYFNWHSATPERRRVADRLAGLSPSIVLVVNHPDQSLPASVRLTADKGPADPAQRVPGQLRWALDAGTYLLNQVHTPDDPDDVLRELSIYFAEPQLSDVLAASAIGADASSDAFRLAEQIESGLQRRSGDVKMAQNAVWHHLQASGVTDRPRTGPEWVAAIDLADKQHIPVDPWFRIVLESAHLPMHRQTTKR